MRIGIQDCKHCGVQYEAQYSGENVLDVPREYQDLEYCPECKKAIVDALSTIPVKFEYKGVQTDEVDLETLLRWEKEIEDERAQQLEKGKMLFPVSRRIFAGLYDSKNGEPQTIRQVIGKEDKKGRVYIYCYWPSDKINNTISVQRRVNLITGEPGDYKIQK